MYLPQCNKHSKKKKPFTHIKITSLGVFTTLKAAPDNQNSVTSLTQDHQIVLEPQDTHWTVFKQRSRAMICSAHLERRHLDLPCVRDWTLPSAKIHCTGEQLWGDRLRIIVRNLESGPCMMTLSMIKESLCHTHYISTF